MSRNLLKYLKEFRKYLKLFFGNLETKCKPNIMADFTTLLKSLEMVKDVVENI